MTGFYLDENGVRRLTWRLKNGADAHLLTREDRRRGGIVRAAMRDSLERRLSREGRGSVALEMAAARIGQLLRSDNLREAEWANDLVRKYYGEPSPHR